MLSKCFKTEQQINPSSTKIPVVMFDKDRMFTNDGEMDEKL